MDAPTVTCRSCNCNKVHSVPIAGDQINKYDYDYILYNTEIPFRFVEWNDKHEYKKRRHKGLTNIGES